MLIGIRCLVEANLVPSDIEIDCLKVVELLHSHGSALSDEQVFLEDRDVHTWDPGGTTVPPGIFQKKKNLDLFVIFENKKDFFVKLFIVQGRL